MLLQAEPQNRLLAPSLDRLSAERMWEIARSVPATDPREVVSRFEASREFYASNSALIDAIASASVSYVTTSAGARVVARLQAWNWGGGPDVGDTVQVKDSGIFGPAIQQAKQGGEFTTLMIGINTNRGVVIAGSGGLATEFDLLGRWPPRGRSFGLLTLGLEVETSVNLMVGALDPSRQHTDFSATLISLSLGVGAQLITFFPLFSSTVFGFAIGTGLGAGGGVSYGLGSFGDL